MANRSNRPGKPKASARGPESVRRLLRSGLSKRIWRWPWQFFRAASRTPHHIESVNIAPENSRMNCVNVCPVCGAKEFASAKILWPELIEAWQLSPVEVEYIDRQQGTYCTSCNNNLRAMALAKAITGTVGYKGTFAQFCSSGTNLKILEINPAGNLTHFLEKLSGHNLITYPEYDMQNLEISSQSFDLVVHSDTLEHVPNPVSGLSECLRILKSNGACIFTIPIIVDRMTKSRRGLPPSFHGSPDVEASDQIVHTEFGADFWKMLFDAGFTICNLFAFEYPAAIAIIAKP